MMKEIGGYFELSQFNNNEYYAELISLNTGRNALLYLIKAKGIKKLYIPYYLCDVISELLKNYEYNFDYYHIDEQFNPIFNKELKTNEYIYIVNYYGQLEDERVDAFKHRYKRIVLDNTHAFFQKPKLGIDTIYSCRKFFGVPDGAYLSSGSRLDYDLELDFSKERMNHLLGRYEGSASDYYQESQKNDKSLASIPLKKMSKLTKNILSAINYDEVINSRSENYIYLKSKFENLNKLTLITPNAPFSYPLYVKDGIKIRKKLAEKKIFIPTLWPNVLNDVNENSIEYQYTANILPLPCDQRYSKEDMEYMVKEIYECIN